MAESFPISLNDTRNFQDNDVCPDEETLAFLIDGTEFPEGGLQEERKSSEAVCHWTRESLVSHLNGCVRCSEIFTGTQQLLEDILEESFSETGV